MPASLHKPIPPCRPRPAPQLCPLSVNPIRSEYYRLYVRPRPYPPERVKGHWRLSNIALVPEPHGCSPLVKRKYRATDPFRLRKQPIPSNSCSIFRVRLSPLLSPVPPMTARIHTNSNPWQFVASAIVLSATISHHCTSCVRAYLRIHPASLQWLPNARQVGPPTASVLIPQCGVPSFRQPAHKIVTSCRPNQRLEWLE